MGVYLSEHCTTIEGYHAVGLGIDYRITQLAVTQLLELADSTHISAA